MDEVRCENCEKEHDGSYGSGRFCGSVCARGFSTQEKREENNRQVSKSLMGHKPIPLSPEVRQRANELQRLTWERKILTGDWDSLSLGSKRRRVLLEQQGKCLLCDLSEWMGETLVLQLDHKDGDNNNNKRENLRGLCPNCHSQTP